MTHWSSKAKIDDPDDSFEWTVEEPRVTGPIRGTALTGIPRERLAVSG